MAPQRLKPAQEKPPIVAVNGCATQNHFRQDLVATNFTGNWQPTAGNCFLVGSKRYEFCG
jgi:hypothetical protein